MLGVVNKLFLLIILYAGWMGYEAWEETNQNVDQLKATIVSLNRKVKESERQKKQVATYLKNIDNKKKEIEEVALQVEKVQKKLPTEVSNSENQALIRSISDNLKIKSAKITPMSDVDNGFYITSGYKYAGKGTYLQFLLLLEKIAIAERILNVREIKLLAPATVKKKQGRYQVLDLTATIESYRYNSAYREKRGIREIEKKFKNKKRRKKGKAKSKRKRRRK